MYQNGKLESDWKEVQNIICNMILHKLKIADIWGKIYVIWYEYQGTDSGDLFMVEI